MCKVSEKWPIQFWQELNAKIQMLSLPLPRHSLSVSFLLTGRYYCFTWHIPKILKQDSELFIDFTVLFPPSVI